MDSPIQRIENLETLAKGHDGIIEDLRIRLARLEEYAGFSGPDASITDFIDVKKAMENPGGFDPYLNSPVVTSSQASSVLRAEDQPGYDPVAKAVDTLFTKNPFGYQ